MGFWLMEGTITVLAVLTIILELFFVQNQVWFVIPFCLLMIFWTASRIRDKVRSGDTYKAF